MRMALASLLLLLLCACELAFPEIVDPGLADAGGVAGDAAVADAGGDEDGAFDANIGN